MIVSHRVSWAVALSTALMINGVAAACPTCKEALAADANASNLVNGFGWSILFMMAMPFLILGGISAYFYYEIRKARRSPHPSRTLSPTSGQATAS